MTSRRSLFENDPDILPPKLGSGMSLTDFVHTLGRTSFEARNLYRAARLLRRMVDEDDVIWLGIAGAGIAGGMGGMVASLVDAGMVDVICSTGAQVYHDLHFAFDLPVKAISPNHDDDRLRRHGDTRIYDIGIREKETLEAQDAVIRRFVLERHLSLSAMGPLSSWQFNRSLGDWVRENAPNPERSFTAVAASRGVPVFWDSLANHSIAMNLVLTDRQGCPLTLSAQKDIFDSAAIVFNSRQTGFVELGGGGPKNFIQQTGPTISQILGIEFEGADRGLQIGTAVEREGSLSGCTFGEAVTWGKYRTADEAKLVQVWGEYSIIFPLLAAYALENCSPRPFKNIAAQLPHFAKTLENSR
jgi:deoxyhypusine synthase